MHARKVASLSVTGLLLAIATAGCVSFDRPPASIKTPGTASAADQSMEEKILAAQERSVAPPPAKLVLLPAGIGSAGNTNADAGKDTAEYWQSRGQTGQFGGAITVATFGSGPKTFNYWAAGEVDSSGFGLLMFETLIDLDPWTGNYIPRLARSFGVSSDNTEFTFVLRKGLFWSDGMPITADDVVFTLNKLVKEGFGSNSISARDTLMVEGEFPSVTKVDDLTIKIKTKKPFAPFLSSIRGLPIAPKHALAEITTKPQAQFAAFWDINMDPSHLVVSGPFRVTRYVPAQRVEMERNPKFAMVDSQGRRLPYLDRFVMLIVPDQNTEILKFYGNEVDLLDIRAVRGLDAAIMKQKESTGGFTMHNLGPDDGTMFLMLNECRRKNPKSGKFYVDPIKQKWFNNKLFRCAISHAIDRRRIVDNVLRGVGLPLYTAESPAALYFNKSLKAYPQDLKLAADLLEQGGFVLKDDILRDAENNRVEFTLITNAGNTTRDATCIMIQNDLKKLGIKVNYHPVDFNIMIDKTETSLDWEAIVMGLTGDKIEPHSGSNVWHSNSRLHMFDQRLPDKDGVIIAPDARPWEKEIDRCFDEGATTFDQQKRHKIYDRFQQIVFDENPYIYLYSSLDITAMKNRFGNYKPTSISVVYSPKGSMHNVEEIFVRRSKP
jgi:peptide/nickel transport system substrate-binding protein